MRETVAADGGTVRRRADREVCMGHLGREAGTRTGRILAGVVGVKVKSRSTDAGFGVGWALARISRRGGGDR